MRLTSTVLEKYLDVYFQMISMRNLIGSCQRAGEFCACTKQRAWSIYIFVYGARLGDLYSGKRVSKASLGNK